VALVDIVPTLLELLGKPTDLDRLNGQSLLVPALTPERADPSRPIFCSIASITDKYGTFLRRAVRQGNYALLHDHTLGRYEFFDMVADPREQNDIVGQTEHAARIESMKALLTSSLTGNLRDHKTMKAEAKESKDPE
jgi:arylsulfatase A-like enzyme